MSVSTAAGTLPVPPGFTRHEEVHDRFATTWWDVGDGPPLVLVHGGGAGADAVGNWHRSVERLATRHRILALDMLGFGGTTPLDDTCEFSQRERVHHLTSWLDAVGVDRASFVGNSMGGSLVLQFAIEQAARVNRVVLMGSAGLAIPVSPELHEILSYHEPDRDAMERIVRGLTHPSFDPEPELVDYRYVLTMQPDVLTSYGHTMALVAQGDMLVDEDALARLERPVLVMGGRDDRVVPFSAAVRFFELLPRAWLHGIPACGHWPMLELPDHFADVTLRFLGGGN
jgi:2-hydroxy-6-oxo-6-(2'-aminophenyl)hexa-2,4-dienoate hydrolase